MKFSQINNKLKKDNISTYPKIRTNKVFLNDIGKLSKENQKIADKFYDKDNLYLKLPYKFVNVDKIVPTQINLTIDNLKSVSEISSSIDAFLVKEKGLFYIIDGHHRIAINILKGESKVKIFVLDLDN